MNSNKLLFTSHLPLTVERQKKKKEYKMGFSALKISVTWSRGVLRGVLVTSPWPLSWWRLMVPGLPGPCFSFSVRKILNGTNFIG